MGPATRRESSKYLVPSAACEMRARTCGRAPAEPPRQLKDE